MSMFSTIGQNVLLNEVVSSNSNFLDEDGDSPDWFEIRNTSASNISLEGWTVSDDADNPDKWTFPPMSIDANEYLYIWASGKDKRFITTPRTLIDRNEDWKYITPPQPVTLSWIDIDFNDSNWFTGKSGFGYADNDDVTLIPAGTPSVFMRKNFTIADADQISELILDIDYDDAFVAYINGVEIARANIEGDRPNFNDYSIVDHEAQIYAGGKPDRFLVPADVLEDGENVLSIQAHNVSASSSDFTLIPFLSALYLSPTNEGMVPPEILELRQRSPHTNFKLSIGETLYLYDANGNKIDQLLIANTPANVSLGRRLQDNNLVLFETPSPGQQNEGNSYEGYLESDIAFSHPGGIVDNIQLSLSGGGPQDIIRYTMDATTPDNNSFIYTAPIEIFQNTVIRARIFREGFLPSRTQSATYLTNVSHDLPVVSLVTDPQHLFDNETGIYELGDNYDPNIPHFGANFWEDWERPVNYTLYEEDNSIGINFDAGIKIFGGWSRSKDQRSFSIFARGEYGTNEIDYPLFPQNDYEKYQALVLRNAGNDFLLSNLRDIVLTSLMDGSGIETQAFRPVATYINGDYWGLYNMREKVNEHFLASKQNVNPDQLDMLGPYGELILGDDSEYIALQNFLETNSFTSDDNYEMVAEQIDVENFIIYNVAQIFFDNTDWPGNNIKYWKPEGGKWRWILYDADFGFGVWNANSYFHNTLNFALEPNGPGWPNPPHSTLMLRRLVENEQFRHQFINRFADELNSRFLPDRVEAHIENIASMVSAEMVNHYSRWGESIDVHNYHVQLMKNFANFRPSNVKSHIRSVFGLPAFHQMSLQINNPNAGYVKLNSLTIKNPYWQGDYFEDVPVKITAVAKPGYTFSHWSGDVSSTDSDLTVDMKAAMSINAIFEESSEEQIIIINEINYNSQDEKDAGDWVEFYNPNDNTIDLTDWSFTDDDIEGGYTFPQSTVMPGKSYLVIAKDLEKFKMQHPDIDNVMGNLGFGLSSNGDILRVFNNVQELVDSVQYDSKTPWSEMADGLGYTLELISPELNNALAENWKSINIGGSPGKVNEKSTSIAEALFNDLSISPNPFSDKTTIQFSLLKSMDTKITLHKVDGSRVSLLHEGKLHQGKHELHHNLAPLNQGVYYVRFAFDNKIQSLKWLKI